ICPPHSSFSWLIPTVSFFFQAEDGIRDFHVTGVQTCALPICHPGAVIDAPWPAVDESALVRDSITLAVQVNGKVRAQLDVAVDRSEERRVGKGCRWRSSAVH